MHCRRLLSITTKIICSHNMCAARMLHGSIHKEHMMYEDMEKEHMKYEDIEKERLMYEDMENWFYPGLIWLPVIYRCRLNQLTLDIASLSPPLSHARRSFNSIYNTDIYTWNSVIRHSAHSDQNLASDLDVHQEFQTCVDSAKSDTYAHENLPRALENLVVARDVEKGHCIAMKCGVDALNFVENALVRFYGACGEADSALKILELMPDRNLVAWNSVLIGHVINVINKKHDSNRVLVLCRVMLLDGLKPDEFTLVSALTACAQNPWLEFAVLAHGYMYKVGLDKNLHAANALLYYYAKCGPLYFAERLFSEMEEKNVVSWNSMIVGMSVNKRSKRALKLFKEFERDRLVPNEITLAGVLLACVRKGLWKEGLEYFERLTNQWGIEPIIENYACKVELFAWDTTADKIVEFIQKMPVKPNKAFWIVVFANDSQVALKLPISKRERDRLLNMVTQATLCS